MPPLTMTELVAAAGILGTLCTALGAVVSQFLPQWITAKTARESKTIDRAIAQDTATTQYQTAVMTSAAQATASFSNWIEHLTRSNLDCEKGKEALQTEVRALRDELSAATRNHEECQRDRARLHEDLSDTRGQLQVQTSRIDLLVDQLAELKGGR